MVKVCTLSPTSPPLSRLVADTSILLRLAGIRTRNDTSHILPLPPPITQSAPHGHRAHDLRRRLPRILRRTRIRPHRLPYPSQLRFRECPPSCSNSSVSVKARVLNKPDMQFRIQFEASRLVMVEILLKGIKMDPLVSLYYYAPVCAALNLLALPFTEGLAPFRALLAPFTGLDVPTVHPAVLLSNAGIAFVLNVASVFLIGVGSGLVLTLAGVLKDIILIAGAVLLFGKSVTGMQVLGTLSVLFFAARRAISHISFDFYRVLDRPRRLDDVPEHEEIGVFVFRLANLLREWYCAIRIHLTRAGYFFSSLHLAPFFFLPLRFLVLLWT